MVEIQLLNSANSERVLFLNPMGATKEFWEPVAFLFKDDFEICFCEYPGYSTNPYKPYHSVGDIALSINIQLLDLEPKPIHIIGFSFGSWVAQQIISIGQIKPSSLVLIGSSERIYEHGKVMIKNWLNLYEPLGINYILAQIGLWSFYTKTFEEVPDLLNNYIKRTVSGVNDNEAVLSQMRVALYYTESIDLSMIECPALILRGTFDHFFPKFCSEHLISHIKNSMLVEVPNSAHAAVIENPFFVGKQLIKFIQQNVCSK
jgi:pimeloyl-ACP methyl ester carboxylesterase